MTPHIWKGILACALGTLVSCQMPQSTLHPAAEPDTADFPTANLPLPSTDYKLVLPPAPELEVAHAPRKDITETFSAGDINHIRMKDPKLFASSQVEVIDLSLIPEGDYAFPLPNAKVISPYGGRRRHAGVDLKTRSNDTIVAAFDGIVRMAKPYAAYGNVIVIRHYNGLETIYSHNSKNLVKPGDLIKAGQPIALTGRTGRATTEHLHFETRINGEHFNPNIIFDLKGRTLRHKCIICTKKGNNVAVTSVDLLPHQKAGPYRPAT